MSDSQCNDVPQPYCTAVDILRQVKETGEDYTKLVNKYSKLNPSEHDDLLFVLVKLVVENEKLLDVIIESTGLIAKMDIEPWLCRILVCEHLWMPKPKFPRRKLHTVSQRFGLIREHHYALREAEQESNFNPTIFKGPDADPQYELFEIQHFPIPQQYETAADILRQVKETGADYAKLVDKYSKLNPSKHDDLLFVLVKLAVENEKLLDVIIESTGLNVKMDIEPWLCRIVVSEQLWMPMRQFPQKKLCHGSRRFARIRYLHHAMLKAVYESNINPTIFKGPDADPQYETAAKETGADYAIRVDKYSKLNPSKVVSSAPRRVNEGQKSNPFVVSSELGAECMNCGSRRIAVIKRSTEAVAPGIKRKLSKGKGVEPVAKKQKVEKEGTANGVVRSVMKKKKKKSLRKVNGGASVGPLVKKKKKVETEGAANGDVGSMMKKKSLGKVNGGASVGPVVKKKVEKEVTANGVVRSVMKKKKKKSLGKVNGGASVGPVVKKKVEKERTAIGDAGSVVKKKKSLGKENGVAGVTKKKIAKRSV